MMSKCGSCDTVGTGDLGEGRVLARNPDSTRYKGGDTTYPAYYVIMVGKVSFAVLAAVDLVAVKIGIVGETHAGGLFGRRGEKMDVDGLLSGTAARLRCRRGRGDRGV
jgi:hypothetical protein